MPDDSLNHLDLQPAEASVADHALMDRLDAWSRGELHDLRAEHGASGLPGPMLEDMRRVRVVRHTIIGAAMAVLAMFVLVMIVIAYVVGTTPREGPREGLSVPGSGHGSAAEGSVVPMDDHTLAPTRSAGSVRPSVRQLHQLNPDYAVEQLVLPEPDSMVGSPSRGTRPAP